MQFSDLQAQIAANLEQRTDLQPLSNDSPSLIAQLADALIEGAAHPSAIITHNIGRAEVVLDDSDGQSILSVKKNGGVAIEGEHKCHHTATPTNSDGVRQILLKGFLRRAGCGAGSAYDASEVREMFACRQVARNGQTYVPTIFADGDTTVTINQPTPKVTQQSVGYGWNEARFGDYTQASQVQYGGPREQVDSGGQISAVFPRLLEFNFGLGTHKDAELLQMISIPVIESDDYVILGDAPIRMKEAQPVSLLFRIYNRKPVMQAAFGGTSHVV